MALQRLQGLVYRFYLAGPGHFADPSAPTKAELNANPTNDPSGTIFNLTCALATEDTTFDLGDSERDDSLTFCQLAGAGDRLAENPEVVFGAERSRDRWILSDPETFNTANLAFSLLAHRGVQYTAIMSVGKAPDAPFVAGDQVKMVDVETDHGIDLFGPGEYVRLQQNFVYTGGAVSWNVDVVA